MPRAVSLVLLLLLIAAAWLFLRRSSSENEPAVDVVRSAASPALSTLPAASRTAPGPIERSTLADDLNDPASDIERDLRLVSEIVATFRTNFLQTGNPTGTNAEITAALTGRNQLRLALIPPDHPAINGDGELCDRWGTPFFFHAESATRMEIRSAGPDRKMWTNDDTAFAP